MFAFALWDETKRTLVLARDRFGKKPLYLAADERQLAFASELKALTAAGLAGGSLDWDALEAFFRLGYVPAPMSPFAGVRKLEPGHVLVWHEDGRITTRRYWDFPRAGNQTPADPEELVRSALDESVAAHLVADVPLAVLLSGGLDSSAVLASMALAGRTPHAYTARYHGSGSAAADETGLAAALAQRYGARLTVVDVEPNIVDLIEPIVLALDEPHADESAVPTWLISQRVASEYKVALSGTGGDELFAGYRRHFALRSTERWTRLPAALRAALAAGVRRLPEPRGGSLAVHRLKRFVATQPGSVPQRYLALLNKLPGEGASIFRPDLARELGESAAAARLEALYREGGSPAGIRAGLYLDYQTYLPDDLLHVGDRISMAHSLELRVPFVDHLLVERLYPLADRVRIGRGRPKDLLRRALANRLPPQHFTAPKRGFVGPTALWLRNELRDLVRDELSADRMRRLGFFDSRAVDALVDDHMSRRHNRESVLWALLSFSIWHRNYCETPAAPARTDRPAIQVAS